MTHPSARISGSAIATIFALTACVGDPSQRVGPDGYGVPVTVIVMPNSLTAHTDEIVQLESFGLNDAGDSIQVALDWESDGGAVGATGTFTAYDAGTYHVIGRSAASPFPADTTTIVITAAPVSLASIAIIPLQPIIAPNTTRPFLADGIYSDSSVGSVAVSWTATGGTISPEGIFTAGATEGSYQVTATSLDGRIAVTTGVTISTQAPTVQQVVLSPDSVNVLRSGVVSFHAFAHFSDGSFAPVSANYTTTSGTITGVGRLTAGSVPGTYRVIAVAEQGGAADTAALVITNSTVRAISIAPPSVALQAGSVQQFDVLADLDDGSTTTVSAVFSASGGTITSAGLFTAGQVPGVFAVIATNTASGLADTASVAVSGPAVSLVGVALNPSTVSILPGNKQQFTAVGLLSDGTSAPILVTWTASGGFIDANGLFTAPQVAGQYSVIANSVPGGKADTSQVTVNNVNQLQYIQIAPATSQLAVGGLQQYSTVGYLADGSQTSVNVSYSTNGGTITAGGTFTADTVPGSYQVIGTIVGGTLADTADVTIIDLPPTGSAACSNEPPGYSMISNQPFDAKPPVAPAVDQYGWNVRGSDAFRVSSDLDTSAPKSAPDVMRGWFRAGGNGGSAPFRLTNDFDRNYKAIYVCLFTLLDPSFTNNGNSGTKFGYLLSPYHSGTQKINHYFNLTNSLGVNLESHGGILNRNMRSSFNLVNHRGVWHKVEFLVVGNSLGKSDGIVRMWVDDAKVLDFGDVQYFFPAQAAAFNGITWNPTYGGGSNPIPYDMYQWVDNWYISGN